MKVSKAGGRLMPWEPHEHRRATEPDAEGDILCTECALVLDGPAKREAEELSRFLFGNKKARLETRRTEGV